MGFEKLFSVVGISTYGLAVQKSIFQNPLGRCQAVCQMGKCLYADIWHFRVLSSNQYADEILKPKTVANGDQLTVPETPDSGDAAFFNWYKDKDYATECGTLIGIR